MATLFALKLAFLSFKSFYYHIFYLLQLFYICIVLQSGSIADRPTQAGELRIGPSITTKPIIEFGGSHERSPVHNRCQNHRL